MHSALIRGLLLLLGLVAPTGAGAQLLEPNPSILSLALDGTPTTTGAGWTMAMTPDARYIAFQASAPQMLGPAAPPGHEGQWILLDRQTGQKLVFSVNAAAQGQVFAPDVWVNTGYGVSISDDANRIIFNSGAINLHPGATTPVMRCYLWDRAVGHSVLVDVDPGPGIQAGLCGNITGDGRFVVTRCSQPNAGVFGSGVCVRNLDTGEVERLAPGRGMGGAASDSEVNFAISADGSTVAFGGWEGTTEVGVQRVDRATGTVTNVTNEPGTPYRITLSGNGRWLMMDSRLYDHQTGSLTRVIRRLPRPSASAEIWDTTISRDGRFVVFSTRAAEFQMPITGWRFSSGSPIYRLDLWTDRLDYVSRVGLDGAFATPDRGPVGRGPELSADGRYVIFQFPRLNLGPGYPPSDPEMPQLFLKDFGPAAPLFEPVPVPLDRRQGVVLAVLLLLIGCGSLAVQRR